MKGVAEPDQINFTVPRETQEAVAWVVACTQCWMRLRDEDGFRKIGDGAGVQLRGLRVALARRVTVPWLACVDGSPAFHDTMNYCMLTDALPPNTPRFVYLSATHSETVRDWAPELAMQLLDAVGASSRPTHAERKGMFKKWAATLDSARASGFALSPGDCFDSFEDEYKDVCACAWFDGLLLEPHREAAGAAATEVAESVLAPLPELAADALQALGDTLGKFREQMSARVGGVRATANEAAAAAGLGRGGERTMAAAQRDGSRTADNGHSRATSRTDSGTAAVPDDAPASSAPREFCDGDEGTSDTATRSIARSGDEGARDGSLADDGTRVSSGDHGSHGSRLDAGIRGSALDGRAEASESTVRQSFAAVLLSGSRGVYVHAHGSAFGTSDASYSPAPAPAAAHAGVGALGPPQEQFALLPFSECGGSGVPGVDGAALTSGERPDDDAELARQIGRAGEEHVFATLRARTSGGEYFECVWVNERRESGLPYDIELQPRGGGGGVQYIEVKSTLAAGRRRFPISVNEVVFAASHMDTYQIIRVFCATTADAHAVVMRGMGALDMEI